MHYRQVTYFNLQVEVSQLDVADAGEARKLVALASSLAPLAGVFHLAMVLKDIALVNMVRVQLITNKNLKADSASFVVQHMLQGSL